MNALAEPSSDLSELSDPSDRILCKSTVAPSPIEPLESVMTAAETNRVVEANRRLEIVNTFLALTEPAACGACNEPIKIAERICQKCGLTIRRLSKVEAVRQCGESYTTIWRWVNAFRAEGYNGLLDDRHLRGRKTALEKAGLTQKEIDEVTKRFQGINLDTESQIAALRGWAQTDQCPEGLARVILDPNRSSYHNLPRSIRELAKVNEAVRKAHRGPRQLALGGMWTPRKVDILPGDIFSSDDTTPIWAWWVPWPESEDYPFGCKLLQGQLLPVIDVASQKVLSFALIAREKSSYRASDIWALFGHTFDDVGLPRLGWQLERGTWESGLIAGHEVEYQEGEISAARRVGGLRQLPTNVTAWHRERLAGVEFPKTLQTWTSFLPKSKSIEGFFNRSQTLEGTLWGSLGRDQMRKPYERAKKLFQECSRPGAKEDMRNHFLSQKEMAARAVKIWDYLNNEPMEGEVFSGIPEQKWQIAFEEYPLLRLPDEERWLYARDWKRLTITQGWARVRLTDEIAGQRYSLFYSNPKVFAQHEGEEVLCYYDRVNFEQPAQILLARTGQYLCEAKYHERTGSFLGGDKSMHHARKEWKDAVMALHVSMVKHAPSRQLPPEIAQRRERSKAEARLAKVELTTPSARAAAPADPEPEPEPMPADRSDPSDSGDAFRKRRERLARQAERARNLNLIS